MVTVNDRIEKHVQYLYDEMRLVRQLTYGFFFHRLSSELITSMWLEEVPDVVKGEEQYLGTEGLVEGPEDVCA